ncbi:MAG: ATP-binding protein [Syntrophobacteraceae bacterium]|nr:ATP-binding protein [Syntrophobacteraceae bacterium]MCU0587972.1 ATP-binding protein [Syntrophobacteraceae bacterium]
MKRGPRKRRDVEWERDRLRAILDSMEDGIYIVGRDYRIDFMNLALRSEVGDGEGQLCHELFGHDSENCDHCLHGMGSFGPQILREWTFAATGKTYEMAVAPIHEPEGHISRLHILRDITERKRLEARLQEYSFHLEARLREQAETLLHRERLALLGEISAGLAHEIRTPLGAIITGIKVLEKGHPREEERRLIFELLMREATRLKVKVSEFLAYARPRTPQLRQTSVARLFDEVLHLAAADEGLAGRVHLEKTVDSGAPEWPMDKDLMKEALHNLCINALQALQGDGSLRLESRFVEGSLELLVKDDGPGIPSHEIQNIFKPFHTLRPEGTGLGLSICREIVESHGGRVSASSIPGNGATFRILLPHTAPSPISQPEVTSESP